jgi:hypothetical protein
LHIYWFLFSSLVTILSHYSFYVFYFIYIFFGVQVSSNIIILFLFTVYKNYSFLFPCVTMLFKLVAMAMASYFLFCITFQVNPYPPSSLSFPFPCFIFILYLFFHSFFTSHFYQFFIKIFFVEINFLMELLVSFRPKLFLINCKNLKVMTNKSQ